MAKSKSSAHKNPVYSKIKDPVKPGWMRVIKIVTIILVSILMLFAIAGAILKYYRLVSKH